MDQIHIGIEDKHLHYAINLGSLVKEIFLGLINDFDKHYQEEIVSTFILIRGYFVPYCAQGRESCILSVSPQ